MDNNRIAGNLIDIVNELVQQTLESRDRTILCKVKEKRTDGSYDVSYIPEGDGGINGIFNMTRYDLAVGDYVYVFKPWNQSASSFICGVKNASEAKTLAGSSSSSSGSVAGAITSSGTLLDVINGQIALGDLAILDKVSEDDLDDALKKKINNGTASNYITSVDGSQLNVKDGRLSVKAISTDLLVQGEQEVVLGDVSDEN